MSPVKASPLEPAAFVRRFETAARAAGFRSEIMAEVEGVPLAAYTVRTPGPRPRIYISSGIHGDEPAPPEAVLHLLQTGVFDHRAVWFLCPLLNPAGFSRATRENAGGVDLNRDYKDPRSPEIAAHVRWLESQPRFDLTLCVHEDWEATGFYLYELNPELRPTLADAMIASASAHMPIEPATVIDGRTIAAPGVIRPVSDPLLRETWPESIYLCAQHTALAYTIETSSALPLNQRVDTLAAVITGALDVFFASTSTRASR